MERIRKEIHEKRKREGEREKVKRRVPTADVQRERRKKPSH